MGDVPPHTLQQHLQLKKSLYHLNGDPLDNNVSDLDSSLVLGKKMYIFLVLLFLKLHCHNFSNWHFSRSQIYYTQFIEVGYMKNCEHFHRLFTNA